MSARKHGRGRKMFEGLESRVMLSVDPKALLAEGFVPIVWQGQETFAKPGEWVVRVDGLKGGPREQLGAANALLANARNDLRASQHLGDKGLVLVQSPKTLTHPQLSVALQKVPGFEHLEPNFAVWTHATPNDPYFANGSLWGLDNTGQSGGKLDADVDGPEAWDLSAGSDSVLVGVIDSGVDYNHPDLKANIWSNPGEVAGDKIDNDKNGYVDDVHGYDFYNNDGDPMDDNQHGTHVSGTIAGVGNNGTGITGVSWNSKIVGLKFLSARGSGSTSGAIAAVNYATKLRNSGLNIRVTNNSWGGGGYSQELYNAIKASGDAGMLFVAAAGNGDRIGRPINNDSSPQYPASYDLPNIIAVAATDRYDNKASWSNYGATSVDLGAPGVDILSTVPGGGYKSFSGTSMATPHVAGAAALAWSVNATATYATVRDAIFSGTDPNSALEGITVTGGRLNVHNTLKALGPAGPVTNSPPDAVDDAATTYKAAAMTIDALSNDSDVNGDALIVSAFDSTGTKGTVTNNGDGTFLYDPTASAELQALAPGQSLADSFTYTITDGEFTDTAIVSITVTGSELGDGLTVSYYSDDKFGTQVGASAVDGDGVNDNWGPGSPAGLPANYFTVRWMGQLTPVDSGYHRLYAKIDDNVRVWIDDPSDTAEPQLVLRRWGSANTSEYATEQIRLQAGQKYNIQMDFKELTGDASAYLSWSSATITTKQVIPGVNLYSEVAGAPMVDPYLANKTKRDDGTTIGIDNGDGSKTIAVSSLTAASSSRGHFSATPVNEGPFAGLDEDSSATELEELLA